MGDLNKIQASLLAFACGDALGATVEFMSPGDIKREIGVHRDIIGGGWLNLKPGEVTDDTQMTICVARSLVTSQEFNLKDIADRFVEWCNSNPPDIGKTCRAGILRYSRTGSLKPRHDVNGAGNGGVMRALPLILLYSHDQDAMRETVVSQSWLTHNNRESDMGCRCYADLVAAALSGANKEELRKIVGQYPLFAPDRFDGKSGGYIVDTLRTVLYYFFATGSLEECIVAVVNNGQDADTTGALAGGLAGAFYGLEAVPGRWLDALDLDVHNELQQLAEQLSGIEITERV